MSIPTIIYQIPGAMIIAGDPDYAATIVEQAAALAAHDATINTLSALIPLFKMNQVAFMRESAAIGHLEKVQINGISWDHNANQWLYRIVDRMAGQPGRPNASIITGPKPGSIREYRESELTDLCTVTTIIKAYLEAKLSDIETLRATNDCGGSSTSSSSDQAAFTPLFKMDQVAFMKESAALGHLEKVQVNGIAWDHNANQWLYRIIDKRAGQPGRPDASIVTGPKPGSIREYRESELTDLCTATGIVKAYLEAKLLQIDTLRATHECGGTS